VGLGLPLNPLSDAHGFHVTDHLTITDMLSYKRSRYGADFAYILSGYYQLYKTLRIRLLNEHKSVIQWITLRYHA